VNSICGEQYSLRVTDNLLDSWIARYADSRKLVKATKSWRNVGGDLILGVNEIQITGSGSYDSIDNSILTLKPGDSLVIKVFRQGQIQKLSIPVEP